MSEGFSSSVKGKFEAQVCSNRQIGPGFYRLRLQFTQDGAGAFANFMPGQFAQFDLSKTALPAPDAVPQELCDSSGRKILLRRPFSFAEVTAEEDITFAELLYCVVSLTARDNVIDIVSLAGAKTAEALPFESRLDELSQHLGFSVPEFAKYGIESILATDDGSAGYHGLVTDCLVEWLEKSDLPIDDIIICACGPEPMLASVAKIAAEKNIDCQVSMERRMACGIGLCQSCAVECKVPGSNETIYKMCCQDGPVFDAREVVFSYPPPQGKTGD